MRYKVLAKDGFNRADAEISAAIGHRPRKANGMIFAKNEKARFALVRIPGPNERHGAHRVPNADRFVLNIMKAAEPKFLTLEEIWAWMVSLGQLRNEPELRRLQRKYMWKRMRRLMEFGYVKIFVNADEDGWRRFDPVI